VCTYTHTVSNIRPIWLSYLSIGHIYNMICCVCVVLIVCLKGNKIADKILFSFLSSKTFHTTNTAIMCIIYIIGTEYYKTIVLQRL
jgi:hypothetical protein